MLQHIDWICSNPPPLNVPTVNKSRYIWIVDLPQKRHNVSLFLCEKIGHPTTRSTQVQLSQRCRWFSTNEAPALPEEDHSLVFNRRNLQHRGMGTAPAPGAVAVSDPAHLYPLAPGNVLKLAGSFQPHLRGIFWQISRISFLPWTWKDWHFWVAPGPRGSCLSACLDGRMREVVLPKVSGQGCSLGCQSYICSPNLDHILKVLFGPYQKNKIVLTKLSRLGYVSKPLR